MAASNKWLSIEHINWPEIGSTIGDGKSLVFEYLNRWIDPILKGLIFLALVILISSATALFAIAWHQLTTVGKEIYIPDFIKNSSKFILEIFEDTPPYEIPGEINSRLSILVGVLGAFATSFFSLGAAATTWYLRRKIRESATIQTYRVFIEGKSDIRIMLKEYSRGSRVIVFGGDFSWVGLPIATSRISQLVSSNHIEFVSYKTWPEIQSETGSEIFSKISPKISLEKTLAGLKASLIYDSHGNLLSYLYQTKSDDGKKVYVCKLQGTNPDGRRLLQQIQSFAKNYPLVKSDISIPKVILVCGKSKTGKSAFCKSMAEYGYPMTSAGALLKEMYQSEHDAIPTPKELLAYGKQALIPGSEQANKLKDKLLRKIQDANRPFVVDGLRVPWLFLEIVKIYGARTHFLVFESTDTERETRLSQFYGDKYDDALKSDLKDLDVNIEILQKLANPQYQGPGGDFAFTAFGMRKYPNLVKSN